MTKKNIFVWLVALLPLFFFSQEKNNKDKISVEISKTSDIIDRIIREEKAKMKEEVKLVDQLVSDNKISKKEAAIRKNEIAKRYENIINTKIEEQKNNLDHTLRVSIDQSVFEVNIKGDTAIVSNNDKQLVIKKRKNTFNKRGFSVSYGFLNLGSESNYNPFANNKDLRYGNTHSVEVKNSMVRQLFGSKSPWLLELGIAYRSDTYMPNRPQVFSQNKSTLSLENFELGTLKRSKLRNVYLLIPVDLHLVINPKMIDVNGKQQIDARHKNNFVVGLGLYGGVRTRTMNKVKYYESENGDFKKYQDKIDAGINNFLFGAKLSLHYRFLNLYMKKDFTPIFNAQTGLTEKNAIQFGIDLVNVHF